MNNKNRGHGPTLYVDMDGCLCRWKPVAEEELRKEGYFISLQPQDNLVEAVRMLSRAWNVQILSAVIEDTSAKKEKSQWLSSHGLGHISTVFVPNGNVKADYVERSQGQKFLLDDYTKNLREWDESGYIGIKFRNGINGSKGTWQGLSVDHTMPASELFATLDGILAQGMARTLCG